jgi:hypothetical protein
MSSQGPAAAMSEISLKESANGRPGAQRAAAIVSAVLGITGLAYWLPALFLSSGSPSNPSSVPFIQRVVSMAREQYTPNMGPVVPILGALFCLASALQIPAGIGAALERPSAVAVLRAVGFTKIGLYVTSGLLLGLAIFSSVRAGDPSWSFSAVNWVANLGMIGVYYWIVRALGPVLSPDDILDEETGDEEDEE